MIMPRASTHSNPALLLLHTVNCRFYQRAAKRFRINSKISSKLVTFSIRSAYFWRGVSGEEDTYPAFGMVGLFPVLQTKQRQGSPVDPWVAGDCIGTRKI